ncbi:MAG: HlyD family efflux transporter periplasmic adaptor subunit [Bacteroidales bacterium]|nr:HlyD family efflux transporter periplasmic adaptor subunit [Bacteroidales bacterium]
MDIIIEKKKGLQKKHIPYIIGGTALSLLIIWLIFGNAKGTMRVNAEDLNIVSVETGRFDDYVRLDGKVLPISIVRLTPEEGGIVKEKLVEEGTKVKKGDVIIRLSNSSLELSILEMQNSLVEKQNQVRSTTITLEQNLMTHTMYLKEANIKVKRTERAFRQQEQLYKNNLTSREVYEQAKEDYELALESRKIYEFQLKQDSVYQERDIAKMKKDLEAIDLSMELQRKRKENLNVKSPIDGELGSLNVDLGQSLGSGFSIGQVNDLSDYKIEALIDEHYIDRVEQGLEATLDRNGKSYTLVVRKVFPEVVGGKFRTELTIVGEHPDNMRSGQTYYINLMLGQAENAIMIPRGTFFQKTGGKWIFVLDKSGKKAYKREIKISRQNPKAYEITEGLEAGEKVIISNYEAFGDNEILELN